MVILTEAVEASSSSPLTTYDYKYDVFLSFRGADTRLSFTNHLHKALVNANLATFLDDNEIETGDFLKPELESAIKTSRASIIVLSENYASSTWCLDELVLILEQKKNSNQIVIPVFYHVEPTHVRKQQNSFGKAMEMHELRMKDEINVEKKNLLAEKMEIWKNALAVVSDLKGKDAKGRMETEFIEEIVNNIYHRLRVPLGTTTLPQLIGRKNDIEFITCWLEDRVSTHTTDILTIWGMAGIGKTSLAKHIYELHRHEYISSFVGDINRRCAGKYHGLLDVQKQLCDDISKTSLIQVHDVSGYTSKIENALARKKVLLVLDDVDSLLQLDALLGNKGTHFGSKIIITTKDASLTERCELLKSNAKPRHTKCTLNHLSESESMELLRLHAFNCNYTIEDYEDVIIKLARYCDGHPLALEVLGKSLHNRDVCEWEDCIDRLKKEPDCRIEEVLKMSFDSLPSKNDKDLFKHIACFFVGMDRDLTETILNACDINTRSGIRYLVDKCLLSIEQNNKLHMHSLVQEMGRDLVRQECLDKPWKRSRLWCHEESFKVLKQKKGKGSLLGLALDMRMLADKKKLHGSFELKKDSLRNMDNLMLLQLNYVQLKGCFENFPEELRWMCMQGFPLKSIHFDLPIENLVALDMSYSNIETFDMSYHNPQPHGNTQKVVGSCSEYIPLLGSLKILDLSFCEQLHSIRGFLELPALERLIVRNCISLTDVCESIEQCVELVHIDLRDCYPFKKLMISIGMLKRVKTLLLDGCNFHESKIETQVMNSSDICINSGTRSSIPSDLKFFMISLPSSLRTLSLANTNLSNESFPMDWSCLSMLKELNLNNNPIFSMPNCVRGLPKLEELTLVDCNKLTSVEHPPPTLTVLAVFSSTDSLRKLKFDQDVSPLTLVDEWRLLLHSSLEIDGIVKIEAIAGVNEKLLHSLGWINIELIKESRMKSFPAGPVECQTQMYYEFGIFSTIFKGEEMPEWIRCRSKGPSISFTIPSSPNKLRGLNFCFVEMKEYDTLWLPMIKISNITNSCTWIYKHYTESVRFDGKCSSLLSHWMFGPNEMKSGDHITITIVQRYVDEDIRHVLGEVKECGICFVYDEDGKSEEDEDVLGYYKSWNHIIGGDLSPFQLATGEYYLCGIHKVFFV